MSKTKKFIALFLVFALALSMFSLSGFGCAEKSPPANEIKVTTPGGTTVTIEKPIGTAGRNPPPVNP